MSHLKRHVNIHHMKEKPFGCDVYHKTFSLNAHLCKPNTKKFFTCNVFNEKFDRKAFLGVHFHTVVKS